MKNTEGALHSAALYGLSIARRDFAIRLKSGQAPKVTTRSSLPVSAKAAKK